MTAPAPAAMLAANETVRPGRRQDIDTFLEIIETAIDNELQPPIDIAENLPPLTYYQRQLRLPKGMMGYRNGIVHERNGVMTGFAICSPLSVFDDSHFERTLPKEKAIERWGDLSKVLNVHVIITKPGFQGRWIPYKLYAYTIEKAKRENFNYMSGQIWEDNKSSLALAKRLHFNFFYDKKFYFENTGMKALKLCELPIS